ncbi:MAG: FecR family protein, partial [Flavobacterium sp.]
MPEKLHQDIKLFLEDKTSLKGQEMWNNWYDYPEKIDQNELIIASDLSKLKREIRVIKKEDNVFFLNSKNYIMAASILLIAGLLGFFYMSSQSIITKQFASGLGEHKKITLSDGTQIWLNAGSLLKYPTEFESDTREVYLTGEAFFDVAKDKKHPFIIHTN